MNSCLYGRIDVSVACRLAVCTVELICRLADGPLSADSLPTVSLGSSSSKLLTYDKILFSFQVPQVWCGPLFGF